MPIKSFSDIDLHGAQLKTSRLDNIPNQSYLNFDGQIGLDTSTDKLEYMNSLGVQIVASEDWVLNNSSQGVNLIQGSGTTFVDYGTAGQVDLGGALTHDTVINGLYNLTFNNKITQINSNSLVGGVNIGSNPNASAALFVDGTNQLGYNSALLVTGSSVVNGGVIPSQGYASYLAYDSTIYTHAAGRIGQWYRVENPTASGFVVNLGDNVTNHNAAMATIGWFPNANGGGLPMTGSSNSPLLSVVKNPYNKNGFDHTGALIDLLNYPDVASNVASGDFVKAHNGAYDQFNVKSDGSVFAAAGTNGLANATTFAFTGYDLQIKKLNYLYIDTPSINIGSNAGQTTGLHGIMPISIGFNANSATQPIGDNAITIGNIAYSTGVNSVAIGSAAAALADRNVSIGSQAGSTVGTTNLQAISIGYQTNFGSVDIGLYSTAVGTFANASSTSSVAIGASSQALSTNSISIGLSTSTTNINAIAIGNSSIATGADSLAIGAGATASASSVIAIGESATASGSQTIAMGLSATSISANAIAIGTFAQGSNSSVVSIGTNANNTTGSVGANAIAIGNNSNSGIVNVGASSVAIGDTATAQNTWDVAIGFNVTVNGVGGGSDSNVGIGSFVTSTGASAVAVGPFTSATGNNGIAIGKGAYANVSEQISIGRDAGLMTLGTVGTSTISIGQSTNFGSNGENYNIGSSSVAIGQQAFTSGDQSIAIGFNAGALTSGLPNSGSVSIGTNANNNGNMNIGGQSVGIGYAAKSIGDFSIALGSSSISGYSAITIGYQANANATSDMGYAISIGYNTNPSAIVGNESIAIGNNATSQSYGTIAIGAATSTQAGGNHQIAIGTQATTTDAHTIAIGETSLAKAASISIGLNAGNTTGTFGSGAISFGYGANSGSNNIGNESIAIGTTTISAGDNSIAIGYGVQLTGTGANIAIGSQANSSNGGLALGLQSVASVGETIAIGTQAVSDSPSSTTIGYTAGTTTGTHGTRHISIGAYSNVGTTGQPSGSILEGRNIGDESIAIGAYTKAVGAEAIAIGYLISTSGNNSISLGQGNLGNSTQGDNTVDNSFALMFSENLPDYHIVKGKAVTTTNVTGTLVAYPIADNSTYTINATFNARDISGTAGNAHASWTMQTMVHCDNGNSAVMEGGSPINIVEINDANSSAWIATLDVTGNTCRALVTGTNTQSISWSVILQVTRAS